MTLKVIGNNSLIARINEVEGCIYRQSNELGRLNKAVKKYKDENAKLRKLCEDLIQLPAVPSFDCYGCVYDKWEDCGGILRDCQLIKEAIKLGIKIPSEGDN